MPLLRVLKARNIGFFHLLTGIIQGQLVFCHLHRRHLEHHVHHNGFDDGAQAAGTELVFDGLVNNELKDFGLDDEFHAIHLEELDVLLDDGVLRLGQDVAECCTVERIQGIYSIPNISEYEDTSLQVLRENCVVLEVKLRDMAEKMSDADRCTIEAYLDARDELEFQMIKTALRWGKHYYK